MCNTGRSTGAALEDSMIMLEPLEAGSYSSLSGATR